MKEQFEGLRSQLDVFLQAIASKIDDLGRQQIVRGSRHHELQQSSSSIPLESFSGLKLLIEELAANHEVKLDRVEKSTKLETQEVQRLSERLAATHQASSKKVDDNYEKLAQGLNQLLTESKTITNVVEKSCKNRTTGLQEPALYHMQHKKELEQELVAVRSELSVIKSAVQELHDQTHKEQGLNDKMKELRLQQMAQVSQVYLFLTPLSPPVRTCINKSLTQYDRVAKLKDDLIVKYRLGGG